MDQKDEVEVLGQFIGITEAQLGVNGARVANGIASTCGKESAAFSTDEKDHLRICHRLKSSTIRANETLD